MIKNYIKTAWRSLVKNKAFTAINVLGLTLGLTSCLLIVFYVIDELSYDRFNTKYDRIYRVNTDLKYNNNFTSFAVAAMPVKDALVNTFPQIETGARMTPALEIRFKKGNEVLEESNAFYADQSIFDVFTLPIIEGDTKTSLADEKSIVISQSLAKKYFNRTDVVGQTLFSVGNSTNFKITAVIKDMPAQSHFKADCFFHMGLGNNNWASIAPFNTYIVLKPGTDYKSLEPKFADLMRKNLNTANFNYENFEKKGNYMRLNLTPLKDIHLTSNRLNEIGTNGNIQYVYIFSAIAVLVLLLACINFMNLSTARSADRAREVGVRKVLGSSRKYLIAQFLSESVIVTITSAVIAVIAAWILLPWFGQLAGTTLVATPQTLIYSLPILFAVVFVVGILAGSYPAFFLSAFQPIQVLKGKLTAGFKGGTLRSVLVVLQFAISIFLVIGTLVIYNQLNYIRNKDLGFKRDQVLIIKNTNALDHPEILRQELKKLPQVATATLSNGLPTNNTSAVNTNGRMIHLSGRAGLLTSAYQVDEDYLGTMGMNMKYGRFFSSQFMTDSSAMVLNETAANMLGLSKDSALNKIVITNNKKDTAYQYHVIGVVKDFNFHSLRDNIGPLVMIMTADRHNSISLKVSTTNLSALMASIENKWKDLAPGHRFEYSFMDQDFDALYRTEQRMGKLFVLFTTLAMVIACLGLFGLAAYAAEQRTQEIGIRKVLGAGVSTIVVMLSKDFAKLVLIAIVITIPMAWWAMQKWLQGYAYRENIHWWVFAVTSLGAIAIALITVSFQSIKAAVANPVDSLRSE